MSAWKTNYFYFINLVKSCMWLNQSSVHANFLTSQLETKSLAFPFMPIRTFFCCCGLTKLYKYKKHKKLVPYRIKIQTVMNYNPIPLCRYDKPNFVPIKPCGTYKLLNRILYKKIPYTNNVLHIRRYPNPNINKMVITVEPKHN